MNPTSQSSNYLYSQYLNLESIESKTQLFSKLRLRSKRRPRPAIQRAKPKQFDLGISSSANQSNSETSLKCMIDGSEF